MAPWVWRDSAGEPAGRGRALVRRLARDGGRESDGGGPLGAAVSTPRCVAGLGRPRRPTEATGQLAAACVNCSRPGSPRRSRDEWAAAFDGSEACVEPCCRCAKRASDSTWPRVHTYVIPDGRRPIPSPARASPDAGRAVRAVRPCRAIHTTEARTPTGLPDGRAHRPPRRHPA